MIESLVSLIQAFPFAITSGLLIAIACSLLGVFVILKRVVFIGIALSEIAACGIAGALLAGMPPIAGAILLTLGAVTLLAGPFESRRIPRDTLLGILFVGASSLSVLLVSRSGLGLQEVKSLLYGDLILASRTDFLLLCAILIPASACLLAFLRPMLYAFLDRDAATVLRVGPARWEMLFFLLLGLVVATASKVAGSLLVFCYLIVPPAIALLLTRRMNRVLILAALLAALITVAGIAISFLVDWPTNTTLCTTACGILLLVLPVAFWRGR